MQAKRTEKINESSINRFVSGFDIVSSSLAFESTFWAMEYRTDKEKSTSRVHSTK
jgi:hypothetical protein